MRGRRRDGGPEGTGRVRPVDCKVDRVKLCCNTQHTDGFPNNECGGCSPSWNQSFEIASEAPPGGKEGGTGSAEGNGVHVVAFCQDTTLKLAQLYNKKTSKSRNCQCPAV